MTGHDGGSTPAFLNPSVPNVARIYDYLLGGKDNFAADREAAEQLITVIPDVLIAARQNREFLRRAVGFLAGEAGIRQFIDIGTGLPTQGNVHEVAHEAAPSARVVYVDHDPVVVSHARALLVPHARALLANHAPNVAAVSGDLRRPEQILTDPDLRALISLGEPVAVLLVAVVHFIGDDDNPSKVLDTLMSAMPPGSYLVLSHITPDEVSADASRKAQAVYADATARAYPRTLAEVTQLFDGLELIEPGVVDVAAWHAEPRPGRTLMYGGVASKPR
jgi:S-adenosyl methyltransferase